MKILLNSLNYRQCYYKKGTEFNIYINFTLYTVLIGKNNLDKSKINKIKFLR